MPTPIKVLLSLCLFTLLSPLAFAGGGDPVPLTKEKAEEEKKELDSKAGDDEGKRGVILASNEGEYFVVTARAAGMALTLGGLMEDAGLDNPLPFPNINTRTLARAAVYLQRLANGETPENIVRELVRPLPMADMQEVLVALNYLDVTLLLPDFAMAFANRFLTENNETDRDIFGNPEAFKKKYPKANLSRDILQLLFGAARMSVVSVEDQRAAMQKVLGDDPKYAAVREQFEKERVLVNGPIVERNILMFGRSRSGKTTLANMVQNYFYIAPAMKMFRGTREPGLIRVDLMISGTRYRLNFFDTPGLFEYTPQGERPRTNAEILAMIKKDLLAFGRPIHLALFTFSADAGISASDIDALQEYIPVLRTVPWIPVITRAEGFLEETKTSIESEIRQYPRMKDLVENRAVFFSGALEKSDLGYSTAVRKAQDLFKMRAALINEILARGAPVQVGDLDWPLAPVVAERNDNVVRWRMAAERAQQFAEQEIPKAPKIWFEMCRAKTPQKRCEDEAVSTQVTLKGRLAELNRLLEEYASLNEGQLPNAELASRIQALLKDIEDLQTQLTQAIPGITKVPEREKGE